MKLNETQLEEVSGGRKKYAEEYKCAAEVDERVTQRVLDGTLPPRSLKEIMDLALRYNEEIAGLAEGSEIYDFETFLKKYGYDKYL